VPLPVLVFYVSFASKFKSNVVKPESGCLRCSPKHIIELYAEL
jgi:hypothetical protein